MEFIVDNLVWFIAGGVVILMTIIGYFAEKTDFGKKLSTPNHAENERSVKEKVSKKDKKSKNNKENDNKEETVSKEINLMEQPIQAQNQDIVQFPVINEIPTNLEQQPVEMTNIEPEKIESVPVIESINTESVAIPEVVNTDPVLVSEVTSIDSAPIVDSASTDNFTSSEIPVFVQPSTIANDNIEIQSGFEEQPVIESSQLQIPEVDTTDNTVSNVSPSIIEESDNKVLEPTEIIEQPVNIPNVFQVEEPVNKLNDLSYDDSELITPETTESIPEETPVIISDENVIPFEQLAATMDIPLAPEGISLPEIEPSNEENDMHDGEQDDEEDIWKF